MIVKGVAYLARETMMVSTVGEARWRDYLASFAERTPYFRQTVLPNSRIPAEAFLALNDDLVATFFDGDPKAYWRFGESSAQFALSQGQMKGFFSLGEVEKFLRFCPQIWRVYFEEGQLACHPSGEHTMDLHLTGLPLSHVYFEYSVMGFAAGGMKFVGADHPQPERLRGFSRGDAEVLYRFRLD